MTRLHIFLLRWVFNRVLDVGTHGEQERFFAVIRQEAEARFYEDNRVSVGCHLQERLAASGPADLRQALQPFSGPT